METLHISLAAEQLFTLFGFLPVTNSLLTTWLVMAFLVGISLFGTRSMRLVPGYLQSVLEIAIEGLQTMIEAILHEKTRMFFPLLATFFFFIIFSNWAGLLPGVGTIGIYEGAGSAATHTAESVAQDIHTETPEAVTADQMHDVPPAETKTSEPHQKFVPLFRAGTADLNTTLALALIAVGFVQYSGFTTLGTTYLKRFIDFSNPVSFFIGLLEIISEFSRILSFAFRLFGNIFAGEVLLVVIAGLMPLLLPLPFLGMELFVGFIQALVFTMLTTVFLSLATTDEGH